MEIKETMEVMDFAEAVAVKVIVALKDGLSPADVAVLLDAELWAKGKVAVEGLAQIPGEVKDLSFDEAAQMSVKALKMAEAIVKAVKAPAV